MSDHVENRAILQDRRGGEVALQRVTVNGRISGFLATVEVEQAYLNPQEQNIEAVYAFPLPMGAVLLALEVEIAGQKLVGRVVERERAERDYENAITDGHSAVMLEEAGPGLYTASLGNLMARESAVIRYQYALPLSWQGSQLRLLLPTTLAPRYGNALAAGMQAHQIPTASLVVEYPLNLSVTIEGERASSTIACPSHPISIAQVENGMLIKLADNAVLDRDFVLTLDSSAGQSACVIVPDGENHVVMASLRTPPAPVAAQQTMRLNVVIDCSGSMGGPSIRQARTAALDILNQLRPGDHFNVTLFGNAFEHVFKAMVPASSKNITQAWNRLDTLDAVMGGTEMQKALDAVLSLDGAEGQPAMLLITDGQIEAHEQLIERARQSGCRVFVVGVGTAVSEVFLKRLAAETGGACELVAPQEGMSEHVLAQFHRIRQARLGAPTIEWPVAPLWQTPLPETVFAGDTIHVFAGFEASVAGNVRLSVQGGATSLAVIGESTNEVIPRIAAAHRIQYADPATTVALSLKYRLLNQSTHYLVIAERAEKAADLPSIHRVPQMLAAGWGLTASMPVDPCLMFPRDDGSMGELFASLGVDAPAASKVANVQEFTGVVDSAAALPLPLRRYSTPRQFVERLTAAACQSSMAPKLPESIAELEALDLDPAIAAAIRRLLDAGCAESVLVIALLHALSASSISGLFEKNLKRHILKRWKEINPEKDVITRIEQVLMEVTNDEWHRTNQIVDPAKPQFPQGIDPFGDLNRYFSPGSTPHSNAPDSEATGERAKVAANQVREP